MSAQIKSCLDNAIKNLVTKSEIDSLKSFIDNHSFLVKDVTAKLLT